MVNKKYLKNGQVKSNEKKMPDESLKTKADEQKTPAPKKVEVSNTNKRAGCC
ncbi:MAG: hypothetical protein Q7U04_10415 [Bacteriovorax sp.]|nr:hypothetical protein [Bacteriovorax sp.]